MSRQTSPRSGTTRPARLRRWAAAAAGVALLGACGTPLPVAAPDPAPAVPPGSLSADQSTRILDSVGQVLASSDAALDPAGLPARLSGPALAIRTAEYVRATATAGARMPTAIPATAQTTVVSATDTWPRTEMVVTAQPDDLQAPLLLVLQQDSPRDPYRLWAWARLGPSVVMPPTADAEIGSAPVAQDDATLAVTPAEAVAEYVDVLNLGDGSAYAAAYPPDFYRTALQAARAQTQASLQAVATVTETTAWVPDQLVALRTADGGALVVAGLSTVTTATLTQGSITLSDPFDAALAGVGSVSNNLVRTWTDVVAMYVPPQGAESTQVQVLAAEHARTSVTGQ